MLEDPHPMAGSKSTTRRAHSSYRLQMLLAPPQGGAPVLMAIQAALGAQQSLVGPISAWDAQSTGRAGEREDPELKHH